MLWGYKMPDVSRCRLMGILAFNGSPRPGGNSACILDAFIRGSRDAGSHPHIISAAAADVKPCRGCLRCNAAGRCSLPGDSWKDLSARILAADALVFASPIYFHHLPSSLKCILDRFRSFVHVGIGRDALDHTPWQEWQKEIVLLLSMGSPDAGQARPVVELFNKVCEMLGSGNRLHVLTGTRLVTAGQVALPLRELQSLYPRLGIEDALAETDYERNRTLLEKSYRLGKALGGKIC